MKPTQVTAESLNTRSTWGPNAEATGPHISQDSILVGVLNLIPLSFTYLGLHLRGTNIFIKEKPPLNSKFTCFLSL